jgi:hypothetical protein
MIGMNRQLQIHSPRKAMTLDDYPLGDDMLAFCKAAIDAMPDAWGHPHGRGPQAGRVLQALCALGLGRWIDHPWFQIDQPMDHPCAIGALHQ